MRMKSQLFKTVNPLIKLFFLDVALILPFFFVLFLFSWRWKRAKEAGFTFPSLRLINNKKTQIPSKHSLTCRSACSEIKFHISSLKMLKSSVLNDRLNRKHSKNQDDHSKRKGLKSCHVYQRAVIKIRQSKYIHQKFNSTIF